MKNCVVAIGVAILAIAALSGCRKGGDLEEKSAPWWETPHKADYSGTIPVVWPFCKPFVDDNAEDVQGFLVVERVKDHPSLKDSGVKPGDFCLSWATPKPEVPKTLRDAWLDFLNWGRSDEDVCWFAREKDGEIEVFPCDVVCLYECMAAIGSFGLALKPMAVDEERFEKIRCAALAYRPNPIAESEDDDEWSEAAANRNLAQLTQALLARDAAAAKPFFRFPIKRPSLLDDVAEENFEAYFPTLFDEGFFAKFEPEAREKGTNLWKGVGWRGFMVANGLMWSDDAQHVTTVNYVTKAEMARLAALGHEEIATLAPELREGVAQPNFAFEAGDAAHGAWRGRVDWMEDDSLRLALWRTGRDLGGPADVVCRVAFAPEGSGGNGCYRPLSGQKHGVFSELAVNIIRSDETPPLELVVSEDGKTETHLGGAECRWSALRDADWMKK